MGGPADETVNDVSEIEHPKKSRDISYYITLVVAVLPVWSVVPLSWAYVVYHLCTGQVWLYPLLKQVLFGAALVEVLFSIYHYHLAHSISEPCSLPLSEFHDLQSTFQRVLHAGMRSHDEEDSPVNQRELPPPFVTSPSDPRAIDFKHALRNWFGKIPWSKIRRQEVEAWIYWSIFNAHLPPPDQIPHSRRVILDEVFDMLQQRAGSSIPDGSSGVPALLLTVDPVNVSSRPFAWYAFVAAANWLIRKRLRSRWNAHFGNYKGMDYMLRIPASWDPATGPRPIIFLHGLGLGLFQYELFLSHLLHNLPDLPLLVPLQPHISQDIFHPRYLDPMGRHETATCLARFLQELGWVDEENRGDDEKSRSQTPSKHKGVTVLSHSNGSFVHSWMLKDHARMVSRSCFVDPVAFCIWEGDVCYNFIYRNPTNAIELLMRYYVATELGVANVLQRHFDWASNSLWCEDIPHVRDPSRNMFFLGGKDSILEAERIRRYLNQHGVKKGLWYDPNGRHGQALLAGGKGHAEILRWLQEGHV